MATAPTRTRAPKGRSAGFVLVSVIWIAGLLAVVSLSIVIAVRSQTLRTRNVVGAAMAQGIADGLARLEAERLAASGNVETHRPPAGQWTACRWEEGTTAWISVQDQGGLIDLNTAAPDLMLKLLEGLVHSRSQALALQQAIADFRDEDKLTQSGDAEPERYSGRSVGPKNQPFAAVEELDQIPEITADLRSRLMALTTVYSQQPDILASAAPPELLRILDRAPPGESAAQPAAQSNRYAITAAVEAKDGSRFVRRVVMEVTQQPQRPFAIYVWSRGLWPAELAATAEASGVSCLN